MNLIKLGDHYINMDLVTTIEQSQLSTKSLWVNFGAAGETVEGEEAEALRHYLDYEAVNVVARYQGHLNEEERIRKQAEEDKQWTQFLHDSGMEFPTGNNYYHRPADDFRYWCKASDKVWSFESRAEWDALGQPQPEIPF
jgi:hypothetical protein